MTGKEMLLQALKFQKTPRLPAAILDGHAWILNRTQLSFKDLFVAENAAQIIAEHYRLLQTDIAYMNGHVFNVVHRVMGGIIECGHIGDAVEITKTPLAEMGDFRKFDAGEVMEKAFATPEYLAVLGQAKELVGLLGEEKIVAAIAYAPFTVAGMLMGVQDFMASMYDDDDETLELIDFAADLVIKSSEKFVECGATAVFVADPVASGDLISAKIYETFALPALKKITATFNARGIPVFCHICGQTENRLPILINSGVAAFSMDAVDLGRALGVARGNFAIMGNLSPFDVILSKTAEEVRAICDERAKTAGDAGGYIMMPGCDLPPKAPLENVLAMVAAAHNAF